jgi:hypothetical protein
MRTWLIAGAVSIVGSLLVACSDEEGGDGVAGSGGAAGTGGSAGTAGSTGTADAGGTAGSGGSTGNADASIADAGGEDVDLDAGDGDGPCSTGCLEVRTFVTNGNQLAAIETGVFNFNGGSITYRIRAEAYGDDNLGVEPFFRDSDGTRLDGPFTSLNSENGFGTSDFVDVTFDFTDVPLPPPDEADAAAPDPDAFDKRVIWVIGIRVGANSDYVGIPLDAGPDGAEIYGKYISVFIDSITLTDADGAEFRVYEFGTHSDASLDPFTLSSYAPAELIRH